MNKTPLKKRFSSKQTRHLLYLRDDNGQISLDFIAGTVIFMVTFMFLFQTLTSLFVPFVSNSDEIKSMADRVAMTLAESTNGLADSPTENNIISVKRAMELNDRMNTTAGYNEVLVSSQPYNVVKYIIYVLHNQLEGIENEEIHRDAY